VGFSIELSDRFLDLVYDAATEPELWSSVLTELSDVTGSQGGVLFGQSTRKVFFDYNGRLDVDRIRLYQAQHISNIWSEYMFRQPVGRLVSSDEIVALSTLQKTAFFDDILRPQELGHSVMAKLFGDDDFHGAFNICRSERQGPMDEGGRRLISATLPHLRRSVALGFRLDGYRAIQRAEYAVLDRLASGVILLDQRNRILYVNAAARLLSQEGGALLLRGGALRARSQVHAKRFDDLILAAQRGTPASAMSIPRIGDGQLLTVLISSVRGRDIERFADMSMPDAAVLIFVVDPVNSSSVSISWLMDAYGLTPAEARVALAASTGAAIPMVARSLLLSQNTIKTHLRRIYAKTGSGRQAELARVIASLDLLKSDDLGSK
jgi:DNA-binding CsgD family transcriptional regulator/PAS domain-containing protein